MTAVPGGRRVTAFARIAFPAYIALTLTACVADERPDGASASGAMPGSSVPAVDSVPGTWSDGDERSEWIARTVDSRLRIDERARFGDDGEVTRTFVYDSAGGVQSAHERRVQTVTFGDRSPARQQVVLHWRAAAADSATKTVDGAPRAVQPYEIENLRRHGESLLALVMRHPTVTPQPDTTR